MPAKKASMNTLTMKIGQPEDEFISSLEQLMRVFSSAVRSAFNRLVEGYPSEQLIKDLQGQFDLNKRYAEDAVLEAQSIIASQKELLPMQLEDTKAKITKTDYKKQQYILGKRKPKKVNLPTALQGLEARLEKLHEKESRLQTHMDNGTLPPVIFGGRKNFINRLKNKITNAEWKELRSNEVFSRGDKSKLGNLNLRLAYEDGRLFIEVAVPFGVAKGKESPRVRAEVHVSDKHFEKVMNIIIPDSFQINGKDKFVYIPYTVRLTRKNGIFYVHLTVEEKFPGEELKVLDSMRQYDRIAGIDVNIDRIAVTILTSQGNFIKSKVFYCHEMEYVSSNRRSNIAGETAKEVVDWLLSENVGAVVVENIKLKQQHDTDCRFNRLTHSFAKKKLLGAITIRALRNGFKVKKVNPAYTSVIGRFKYMKKYGLSVHESASFVIGRRGLGFNERVTKEMVNVLRKVVKPCLIKKLGSMEETEKQSEHGKALRKKYGMWLNHIEHFKKVKSDWTLWNIIHKTIWMKQFEYQLKESI